MRGGGRATEPASAGTDCQHGGTHVSRDFRRIYGDEKGAAHRCLRCDSWSGIQLGSTAGKEVSVAEPTDHPERAASGEFGWSV